MTEGSDSGDGRSASAPADRGPGPDHVPRNDPIRDDIAGIDPLRYGAFGVATFGSLAAAWFLFSFVMAGLSDPILITNGPFGLSMQQSEDLFLAVSNTYALVFHVGPVLGLVLGLLVGRSVDARTPGAVAGAAAVTVGGAVTLFLLAILYTLTAPESMSMNTVEVLEPAFASTLAIAVAAIGGAGAVGVFESFEQQ